MVGGCASQQRTGSGGWMKGEGGGGGQLCVDAPKNKKKPNRRGEGQKHLRRPIWIRCPESTTLPSLKKNKKKKEAGGKKKKERNIPSKYHDMPKTPIANSRWGPGGAGGGGLIIDALGSAERRECQYLKPSAGNGSMQKVHRKKKPQQRQEQKKASALFNSTSL